MRINGLCWRERLLGWSNDGGRSNVALSSFSVPINGRHHEKTKIFQIFDERFKKSSGNRRKQTVTLSEGREEESEREGEEIVFSVLLLF